MVKSVASWMPQTLMLEVDAGSDGRVGCRRWGDQGVELAMAFTKEDHRPSGKILNRETEGVKLD